MLCKVDLRDKETKKIHKMSVSLCHVHTCHCGFMLSFLGEVVPRYGTCRNDRRSHCF